MGNAKKKDEKLEIQLSTKDQTNLEFLTPIFSKISTINFTVLVINQTQKGQELTSNLNHVKIINTYTKGLSVSRNLALKHATGDICLLADDDIKYVDGFSDMVRSIRGVEISMMIMQTGVNSCRINFRSKGKLAVNDLANYLGGGGHAYAAGAKVEKSIRDFKNGLLGDIKQLVRTKVET